MSKNNTQNPEMLTITALFSGDYSFSIPLYQRVFAWTDKEINTLIEDIVDSSQRNEKEYSLGSLVVSSEGGETSYEVVDGQQRLTTLFLILCVLRNHFAESCKEKSVEVPLSKMRGNILHFVGRDKSNQILGKLISDDSHESEEEDNSLYTGYRTILQRLNSFKPKGVGDFADYLLNHTKIMLVPLPERTDLNHYFEIMNTRGVQLEKTDIVKARLMSRLEHDDDATSTFSKVWNACSNMDKFVQMGFDSKVRVNLFSQDGLCLKVSDFNELQKALCPQIENDQNVSAGDGYEQEYSSQGTDLNQANESRPSNMGSTSIEAILNNYQLSENAKQSPDDKDDDESGEYSSILDFSGFLMYVVQLFKAHTENGDIDFDQSVAKNFNDKNLLELFSEEFPDSRGMDEKESKACVCNFLFFLLKVRHLFDVFIIKVNANPDMNSQSTMRWLLTRMVWDADKSHSYLVLTFSRTEDDERDEDDADGQNGVSDFYSIQRDVVMLESMNQVTFTTSSSKTFIYDVLDYVLSFSADSDLSNSKSLLSCGQGIRDCLWQSALTRFQNHFPSDSTISLDDAYGTNGFDVFVFNFIDYVLWKFELGQIHADQCGAINGYRDDSLIKNAVSSIYEDGFDLKNMDKWQSRIINFDFRYRNSIEHFYPQHPDTSPEDDSKNEAVSNINSFGNLCVMTSSENSRRSNLMPEAKIKQYSSEHQSLKFQIMAALAKRDGKWGFEQIQKHEKRMEKLFEVLR